MHAPAEADHAAGALLRELASGREPHPVLRALLIDALQEGPAARLGATRRSWQEARIEAGATQLEAFDNARASAAWLTATPAERGAALDDLLGLADAFPNEPTHRIRRRRFPRLDRSP